ncbi:MAG: TIGR02996 domain-containing protein [Labilithrix sp.]
MSLEELLLAIRGRPDDAELRLVYADALEEAGEGLRAEVIRRSIANDREWVDEALKEHEEMLAGPAIAEHAREWLFSNGLVWWVTTTLSELATHGAAMFRSAPIQRVTIVEGDDDDVPGRATGEALATISELSSLESIDLFTGVFSKKLLDAFTASPHLTSLRHVAFMYGEEADLARVFARAPLPALRELLFWMESGGDGDRVASLLARSERRSDLRRLELSGCSPTDKGMRAIARSPHLRSLSHLLFGSSHYSPTRLTDDATKALAESKLTALTTLELPDVGLDDAGVAPLTRAGTFRLEALDLRENAITELGALLEAPALASLGKLDLQGNRLDDRAAEALLRWPGASNLHYLDVSGNRLTHAAREALRTAPCLSSCNVIVG